MNTSAVPDVIANIAVAEVAFLNERRLPPRPRAPRTTLGDGRSLIERQLREERDRVELGGVHRATLSARQVTAPVNETVTVW